MANLKYKTRGDSSPQGKPRVYFCCHPDDFNKYFDSISDEILAKQNCAIWYIDEAAVRDEDFLMDLQQMQLFVMPVTFRLLGTENDALNIEFKFAMENHIPVLPLMQETGLEALFNQKCGELQFLSKYNTDRTAISYDEKLQKYLASVLIGDELAAKIRAAFDAYIFLSYRKKDRRYAQELMRLIHKNAFCRDIAIWYDEFLTPGENFNDSIKEALQKSDLFALAVTPNIVNELNYIMTTEYPMAKQAGKQILPAELVSTDRQLLAEKYTDLPDCTDAHNESELSEALLKAVQQMAVTESEKSPEHNFFIGLAYLGGVDVEVDHDRALQLITSAANDGLPEAMKKLRQMYMEGTGVALDYRKAVIWAEKFADHMVAHYGEEHPDTLSALINLAVSYSDLGEYHKALELEKKVYELRYKFLGEEYPQTLTSLNNLAVSYSKLGEHHKALELFKKVYELQCKVLGDEHPDTLISLDNLAVSYGELGEHHKALELKQKVYTLRCRILGEEHPDTLTSLNNLAVSYSKLGEYAKALELYEKVYKLRCKVLGDEHPDTLTSLSNLAYTYGQLGEYAKELELYEKVYELRCKILGEEHPSTLSSLSNLASTYGELGEHTKALELKKKVYTLRCRILGEEHPNTLSSLNNLATSYGELGEYTKALELYEKVYALQCKVLGDEHPGTLSVLGNLACIYSNQGKYREALELHEKAYELRCKVLGEEHPNTLTACNNLAYAYGDLGEYRISSKLYEKAYELRCKVLGEEHPDTLSSLHDLAYTYKELGEHSKASELLKKAKKKP